MVSKKSFFNKAIYWKNLKRFYPWAVVYGLLLFIPTGLLQILINLDQNCDSVTMLESVFSTNMLVLLMLPVASLLAGALLYHQLFQDTAVQMFHALPISREAHWISTFLAGLTLLELPLLLVQGFSAVYALALGFTEVVPMVLQMTAAYALAILFYFGLLSFCVQVVGSGSALLVLFGLMNGLAAWVSLLRYALCSLLYPTIYPALMGDLATKLTPIYYLLTRTMEGSWYVDHVGTELVESFEYTIDLFPYLCYALAGLVLMLLGMLLYRHRHLERAGDALAFPAAKVPVQILFATLTGLALSVFFRAVIALGVNATVAVFILGGALGYFVLGMLINKTVHVFKSGWKGYVIFVLLTLSVTLVTQADVLGVESRVPDADEVVSVSFSYYGGSTYTDPDLIAKTIALHQQIIEEYDTLSQRKDNAIGEGIAICYTLEDGSTFARHYTVYIAAEDFDDEDSVASRYYALTNDAAIITSVMFSQGLVDFYSFMLEIWVYEDDVNTRDEYIELFEEEAERMGQALLQDIEDGNVLWNGSPLTGSSTYLTENHSYYNGWIDIMYYTESGEIYYAYGLQLDAGMVHTIAALEELGILTDEYREYLGM